MSEVSACTVGLSRAQHGLLVRTRVVSVAKSSRGVEHLLTAWLISAITIANGFLQRASIFGDCRCEKYRKLGLNSTHFSAVDPTTP